MQDIPRIERLIVMAERLIEALESDIASLKSGQSGPLRANDPEIQKLTALYGREARAGLAPRQRRRKIGDARNAGERPRTPLSLREGTVRLREKMSALAELSQSGQAVVRASIKWGESGCDGETTES